MKAEKVTFLKTFLKGKRRFKASDLALSFKDFLVSLQKVEKSLRYTTKLAVTCALKNFDSGVGWADKKAS